MKEPIGRYLKRQAAGSRRNVLGLAVAGLLCFSLSGTTASQEPAGDDDESVSDALVNPFLGDEAAITQGRRIYRVRSVAMKKPCGKRGRMNWTKSSGRSAKACSG